MSIVGRGISVGGGGSLKLNVVGGTTQPLNPKENTIWVNTSIAIGNIYIFKLYYNLPVSPSVGDIVVQDGTYSDSVELTVSEKPHIGIRPQCCFQYTAAGWEGVESALYTGGAWKQLYLYIINTDIFPAILGDWNAYATKATSYTSTTALPTLSLVGGNVVASMVSSRRGTVALSRKIDFSKYDSMYLHCATSAATSHEFGIVTQLPESNYTFTVFKQESNKSDSKTITVDCSTVSGEQYIAIGMFSKLDLTIKRLHLVPAG